MNHKTNTENKPAKANNKKASQQRMNKKGKEAKGEADL